MSDLSDWDDYQQIMGTTTHDGKNVLYVAQIPESYTNITGAATTVIKTGAGVLNKITFNTPVALSTVTIYDNTAGSGTKIGTITLPLTLLGPELTRIYNCSFSTGLTIVTTGTSDLTVSYT